MDKNKYVTIKLTPRFGAQIDRYVEKYGFRSRTELAKEAIWKLMQELDKTETEDNASAPDGQTHPPTAQSQGDDQENPQYGRRDETESQGGTTQTNS